MNAAVKAAILIVDDDRSACRPLTKALHREGYEPLLAQDAAEAVGLCRQRLPEVVLLALNMKRQSGWEILEQLSPWTRSRRLSSSSAVLRSNSARRWPRTSVRCSQSRPRVRRWR
jgi:PleD family two-component response regulator